MRRQLVHRREVYRTLFQFQLIFHQFQLYFIEILPYSIVEWNKNKGHPTPLDYKAQDILLDHSIILVNEFQVNELRGFSSPRFRLNVTRYRKAKGGSKRCSINFNLFKDGILQNFYVIVTFVNTNEFIMCFVYMFFSRALMLALQEDRGSIPRLATWIFRDWLSPASKSRYGWKIAKSTLIKKTTNQQQQQLICLVEKSINLRNLFNLPGEILARCLTKNLVS